MTHPILPNSGVYVQESLPVISVQQSQASRGLADVQSTIDPQSIQITYVQRLLNFFQRIYAGVLSVVNALKRVLCGCGCCLRRGAKWGNSTDKISNELAGFDNPRVKGQINGIYITTNETNLTSTCQLFSQQPRPETPTIHIGCATWHNLDIICARKSTYGLIIDFNPKNAEFIGKTIETISSCDSRDTFKRAMIHYLVSLRGRERNLFFHSDQLGLPTDRIERELSREGSWLQSEESYLYVKKELVSKGRLISITEDIRNFESFSKMRKFLDRNHIAIDTLYMSNICNFMNTSHEKSSFVKSIKQLLAKDSIFINCPKLNSGMILSQRASLGREILADSYSVSQLFEEG